MSAGICAELFPIASIITSFNWTPKTSQIDVRRCLRLQGSVLTFKTWLFELEILFSFILT